MEDQDTLKGTGTVPLATPATFQDYCAGISALTLNQKIRGFNSYSWNYEIQDKLANMMPDRIIR